MQTIYIDISNKGVYPCVYAKQGDVNRKFLLVVTDSGVPFNCEDTAISVWYDGDSGEGNYTHIGEENAISVAGNKITVSLIQQMLVNAGKGVLSVSVSDTNGSQIGLWNIDYCVEQKPGADSEEAKNYYDAFSKTASDLAVAAKAFVTDKTLSKSDSPADAAETGYRLQSIKNDISANRAEIENEIAAERSRINQFTRLPDGSTSGDAEIADARIDYSGRTYENVGSAIRATTKGLADGSNLKNKAIKPRSIEFVNRSANLFDKTDGKIQIGIYIKKGVYATQSGNSYAVSHPIYMDADVQYKWKHNPAIGGIACAALIDYYNLSIVEGYNTELVEENGVKFEKFTPPVSGYYAVNFRAIASDLQKFMVCRADEYPDTYVSYSYQIHAPIPAEYVVGLDELLLNREVNPLYGKSIALNGDSICASNGGYGKIIAERNAMTYENKAVGGATITAEQYTDSGVARHWISRTIANMDASADYAIVEGGVNDSSTGAPLGAITSNFTEQLDDTTFYGAFESMLKQLTIRFAGKKIGYIAVHKMTSKFRADKPDDGTSYYWAAKKCCEKWGVPFLDLNISVPPFAYFLDSGDPELAALRTTYTQSGDGWHPTEEGFKKYYCDKIEAWMKEL